MKKTAKFAAVALLVGANVGPTISAMEMAPVEQANVEWNDSLMHGPYNNIVVKGLENTYNWDDKNLNGVMESSEFDDTNGNGVIDTDEIDENNAAVIITDGISNIFFCIEHEVGLNYLPGEGYGSNPAWDALSIDQQVNIINYIQYGMDLFSKVGGTPQNIIDTDQSNNVGADYLTTIQTMIWDEIAVDKYDTKVLGTSEDAIESEIRYAIEQGQIRPSFTVITNEDASLNTSPEHTLVWDEELQEYAVTLVDENGVYDQKYMISDGVYGDYTLTNMQQNTIQISTKNADAQEFEFTHLNTDGLDYVVNPYASDEYMLADSDASNQDTIMFSANLSEAAKFKVSVESVVEEESNPSYDIVKEVVSGDQEHNTSNDDTVDGDMVNDESSFSQELITVGDNATYSIVATNTGDIDITPAAVTDSFESNEFTNAQILADSLTVSSNLRGDITDVVVDSSDYNEDKDGKPVLDLEFDLLVGEDVTITFDVDFDEAMLGNDTTFNNFAFIESRDPNIDLPKLDDPADITPDRHTPNVEIPEVIVPNVEIPEVMVPNVEIPEVMVPNVEIPEVMVPNMEIPEVMVPNVEIPEVMVPNVEIPEIMVPNVEIPTTEGNCETPNIEVPGEEITTSEDCDNQKSKTSSIKNTGLSSVLFIGFGLVAAVIAFVKRKLA